MLLIVVGAVVVGLSLGLFGSGGSILTVPTLAYLLGHHEKAAIAESLAIVGAIALATSLLRLRSGDIAWRTAALFAAPGLAGTYAGARLAALAPGTVQLLVFAAVMALAAYRMWKRSSQPARAASPPRSPWRLALDGLGVGVLTGFVGVGGGFLIVPALVLLGGLEMRRATATSLVVIAANSAVGFTTHARALSQMGLEIAWVAVGVFAAVGIAAALAGRSLHGRFNERTMQRSFAIFLVVMAGLIAAHEGAGLLPHHDAAEPEAPVQ